MPQVVIEQPGVPPMTVPISTAEVNFGRAEECDVVLIADEVSRHHAKLVQRGKHYLLMDLKSLNGTYVNQQRVMERVLSHMDEVWLGSKCKFIFRDDTQYGRESEADKFLHAPQALEDAHSLKNDSALWQDMDKIREEMDRVGNSMTQIGAKTPAPAAERYAQTEIQPSQNDLVQMGRAYRRLSAIHRASSIMTEDFDLDQRLAQVLDLVIEEMQAERGFVMLRNKETNNLNVRVAREMGQQLQASAPSMGIAGRAAIDGEPVLMEDRATNEEFGGRDSIILSKITSAMCVPLKTKDCILGSIYIDSRKASTRFVKEDLELFASLATQAAMAIDNVQLHEQVVEAEKKRLNFGRFLPAAIVEQIMNDDSELQLGGKKSQVTTLFCDIRGSSQLAERLSPMQLVEMLNEHFTALTDIIFQHDGTLDKYIGDEIMAVFGAPLSTGDDAFNAVAAALAMQQRNQEINVLRRSESKPEIHVGIGIDTGEVIAGYVGSPQRMDFTVIGSRVNSAKRFCDMAAAGKVVAGEETWKDIEGRIISRPIGTVMLKGKDAADHAYEIIGLKES